MTTVSLGRLVAEVSGEGPAVVMVHGLGGSSNIFQPQMDALSGFRVLRLDLPGSARSPKLFEPLTLAGLTQATVSAVKLAGVERAHFVGHSLGGLICQHVAANSPDLVQSLSLFGAVVEPTDQAREGLRARARVAREQGLDAVAEATIAATLSGLTRSSSPLAVALVRELIMRQDPEGYAQGCEALAKADAADHRLIGARTLIVTGDEDPIAPPSVARALGERIKGASVVVLDRCGHWATIEKPLECNRRLADFLRAA
ncbi:MAG: alpha/beta fold hydrolase [Methylobacteriaceae bacterium]|nr:alpha/beta fold hydrolase [Methylobacteriaceae bacterium]